jgi:hypothetical protein
MELPNQRTAAQVCADWYCCVTSSFQPGWQHASPQPNTHCQWQPPEYTVRKLLHLIKTPPHPTALSSKLSCADNRTQTSTPAILKPQSTSTHSKAVP